MALEKVGKAAWVAGALVALLFAAGCGPAGSSGGAPAGAKPASSTPVRHFEPLTWHETLAPDQGAPTREELEAQYGGEKAAEVLIVRGAPGQFPGEVWFALRKAPVISSDDIVEVRAAKAEYGPQVEFTLGAAAGERFRQYTRDHAGGSLAIVLDHAVLSNPRIIGEIGEKGVINGRFTEAEVDDLVKRLRH